MPINPATLAPGQRVTLQTEGLGCQQHHRKWVFFDKRGRNAYFGSGLYIICLRADHDGTLRDDEGRIVEVRDADPS